MLRTQTRHHVGVAAGRERHDHGHRPARPVRRAQRRSRRQQNRDGRQDQKRSTMHFIPQSMSLTPTLKASVTKSRFHAVSVAAGKKTT
jgi:hypothetical protein